MSKKGLDFGKNPLLPWEPPPGAQQMVMQRLKQRLEAELALKAQMITVLMALVSHLGGEVSFPSATLQAVQLQDQLHYKIENETTTLVYEAVGERVEPAPSSLTPPPPSPPKPRIYLPGDPA